MKIVYRASVKFCQSGKVLQIGGIEEMKIYKLSKRRRDALNKKIRHQSNTAIQ